MIMCIMRSLLCKNISRLFLANEYRQRVYNYDNPSSSPSFIFLPILLFDSLFFICLNLSFCMALSAVSYVNSTILVCLSLSSSHFPSYFFVFSIFNYFPLATFFSFFPISRDISFTQSLSFSHSRSISLFISLFLYVTTTVSLSLYFSFPLTL